MMISLIAAVAKNGVIGVDNSMPWHLPADMKFFRETTMGKPLVMGRKTFESIGSKPLPGRTNIVITRDRNFRAENCLLVHSIDDALAAADGSDEVMIMGGSSFYEQMLTRADRIYLTQVHADIEGDAWFPELKSGSWKEISRQDFSADEKNPFDYSFVILERVSHQGRDDQVKF